MRDGVGPRPLRLLALSGALLALFAAPRADGEYLFHMRRDLARLLRENPDALVGKQVVVTDELITKWPKLVRGDDGEETSEQRRTELEGKEYQLFDTTYFRCAIAEGGTTAHLDSIWADAQKGYSAVLLEIEAVNEQERTRKMTADQAREARRKHYWELYRIWSNQPIVTLFGTIKRAEFWGPVDENARPNGVSGELITLIVERAEKPRDRWYLSLDD